MVFHHFHHTVYGKPICMNISNGHEYRYHYAAVMEIFVFLHFFDHHYLAVSGSNDSFLRIAVKDADRTSEEIHNDQINGQCYDQYEVKRPKRDAVKEII